MKHNIALFTLFIVLLSSYATNGMDKPSDGTKNKIPTLYALCKHQITTGYGKTYDEQRTNALKSIETISTCMNEDFTNDIKRSFIHNHWKVEQSPHILIKTKHKLYGMVDDDMYIWDISNTIDGTIITKKIDTLHTDRHDRAQKITCAIANKNGSFVYTAAKDSMIKIWDTNSHECKGTLPDRCYFSALSENPHGDLCSLANQGEIKIWDVTTQSCKQALPQRYDNATPWRLLADTHMIYAAGGMGGLLYNGPILVYDMREGRCIYALNPHGRAVTALAKSKKDRQFYSSSWDKTIKIWDMRNMQESIHTLESTNSIKCIQENDAGTQLFSCGDKDAVVNIWDLTTDKPFIINSILNEPIIHCMAYDEYEGEPQLFVSTKTGIKIVMPESKHDIK